MTHIQTTPALIVLDVALCRGRLTPAGIAHLGGLTAAREVRILK